MKGESRRPNFEHGSPLFDRAGPGERKSLSFGPKFGRDAKLGV